MSSKNDSPSNLFDKEKKKCEAEIKEYITQNIRNRARTEQTTTKTVMT